MKIVVTASGTAPESPVDARFGRAKQFLLLDTDTGVWSAHDNAQNLNAAQGAGIQAAQTVAGLGAEAVVTGHCGPKAFRVLQAAAIRVALSATGTAADAAAAFQAGTLAVADAADVEGHW